MKNGFQVELDLAQEKDTPAFIYSCLTPFQTHSKFIILEIELVVITDCGNVEQFRGRLGGKLCHQTPALNPAPALCLWQRLNLFIVCIFTSVKWRDAINIINIYNIYKYSINIIELL